MPFDFTRRTMRTAASWAAGLDTKPYGVEDYSNRATENEMSGASFPTNKTSQPWRRKQYSQFVSKMGSLVDTDSAIHSSSGISSGFLQSINAKPSPLPRNSVSTSQVSFSPAKMSMNVFNTDKSLSRDRVDEMFASDFKRGIAI